MKYWAGYVTAAILGAIALALGRLADRYTTLVDMVYPYVTRTAQDLLAQWSGAVPFCLWQVAVMLLLIFIVAMLVLVIVMHWNPIRFFGWVLAAASFLYLETLALQAGSGFETLVRSRSFSVLGGSNLPVKELGWSAMYTAMGTTGITVGLTGEAAVNPNIPVVSMPFTICREMAHRKCIAIDSDAEFAAFLACQANESIEYQYSAYYMAYRYCLEALNNAKSNEAQVAAEALTEGENEFLRHDMEAYARFFKRNLDEKASRLANTVNDTYLKVSGDKGGENSVSDLLVSWHYQEVVLPTITEEEVAFDPKDETQVDLTTTQVPPETEEVTEGE